MGGIGVSNIMYVVVEERTREIGIKLAVGAKPRFIQTQFLLETLTLTAIGGAPRLPRSPSASSPSSPCSASTSTSGRRRPRPLVILTTAALLGLIGFVAGYFPARRASLLDPVVALKLVMRFADRRARPGLAPVPRRRSATRRKRIALTVLAIAWGTLSIVLLLSFGEGLKRVLPQGHARHGRGHRRASGRARPRGPAWACPRAGTIPFQDEDADLLRAADPGDRRGLASSTRSRRGLTVGTKTVNARVRGVDPAFGEMRNHPCPSPAAAS